MLVLVCLSFIVLFASMDMCIVLEHALCLLYINIHIHYKFYCDFLQLNLQQFLNIWEWMTIRSVQTMRVKQVL